MNLINKKFIDHRTSARNRGLDFNLTFSEWWDIWEQSGHWEQRGRRRDQYVMSRKNDIGPYEVGNVFIQLASGNSYDRSIGRPQSEESRQKNREAQLKRYAKLKECDYA
jgi:hypothetical protein